MTQSTLDPRQTADFVKQEWHENVIPSLADFIKIPNVSPSFDAAWDRFFPSLYEHRARGACERLTPQPLGPYLQANPVEPRELDVPSTYVVLEEDRTFPVSVARKFA